MLRAVEGTRERPTPPHPVGGGLTPTRGSKKPSLVWTQGGEARSRLVGAEEVGQRGGRQGGGHNWSHVQDIGRHVDVLLQRDAEELGDGAVVGVT